MTGGPRSRKAVIGWALLGGLLCVTGLLLLAAVAHKPGNHPLYDFRGGLFNAGLAILHGHSPYQEGFLAHQVAIMQSGGIARGETAATAFSIPVYPASANLVVVPLSLMPFWLAGAAYTIASIAAMVGAIRLMGVRDWRCLALALVSWPFIYGLYLGAIGPFLFLGAAIAWRFRNRVWPPAIAIAAIVAAKVFPWPLAVWLLITRRYRTLALAVGVGAVLTFGAWAVIGFDGLIQYPRMLSEISFLQEGRAVSLVALLLVMGVPSSLATAAALAVGAGLLLLAWRVSREVDGERRSFGLVVVAALTATPIVWEHYMVLLFVPIALISPRLSPLWLLPLCTPLLVIVSGALIPVSQRLAAHPPETLRTAIPWLLVQGVLLTKLMWPDASVAALSRRLGLGRPEAAAASLSAHRA